ncbi:uncharacterized protein LOC135485530 [Lineus longissimus]|uniref:uncharacterized protein LOC135485530 n=1 Tax=Lineus longissimus TaxID=88925 RepID=UPI002B4F61BE
MEIKMDDTVGSEVASSPRNEVSKVKVNKCIQTRTSYLRKRLKRKLKLENISKEKPEQFPEESTCYEDDTLAESPKYEILSGDQKGSDKGRTVSNDPSGHKTREDSTFSKTRGNLSKSTTASHLVVGSLGTVGAKAPPTVKGSPKTPADSNNHRERSVNDPECVQNGVPPKPEQLPQAKEQNEARPKRKVSFAAGMKEDTKTLGIANEKVPSEVGDVEPTAEPKQQRQNDELQYSATGLFEADSWLDERSDGAGHDGSDRPTAETRDAETDQNQVEDPCFLQTNSNDSKRNPDNMARNDNEYQVDRGITEDNEVNPITTTTTNRSKVNQDTQTLLTFPRQDGDRGVLLDALSETVRSSVESNTTSGHDLGGCSVLNATDGCVVLMTHHMCTLRKSSVKLTCMSEDEGSEGSSPQTRSPSTQNERNPWGSARDIMVQTESALFDAESVCPSECSSISDFTDIVESSPFCPPQPWEGIDSPGLLDDVVLGNKEGKTDILDWVRGKDKTLQRITTDNARKEKYGEKLQEVIDMQEDKRMKKGHPANMKYTHFGNNPNKGSLSQVESTTLPSQTKRHREKSPSKTSHETLPKLVETDDKQIQKEKKEKKGKTGDKHGSKVGHVLSEHMKKERNPSEFKTRKHRKKENHLDRRNNNQTAGFPSAQLSTTQDEEDLNQGVLEDSSQSRGMAALGQGSEFPGSCEALSAPSSVTEPSGAYFLGGTNEQLEQQPLTTQQFDPGQSFSGYHDQTLPTASSQRDQQRYMATDIPQSNEIAMNNQQSAREPITDKQYIDQPPFLDQKYEIGQNDQTMHNQSTVPGKVLPHPQDVPYSQNRHQFPESGRMASQIQMKVVAHPQNQTSFSSQLYQPNQRMQSALMRQPVLGQPVQYGTAPRLEQPRQPEMASYYPQATDNVKQLGLVQPQQSWPPVTPQRCGPSGQQPIFQTPLQPREMNSYHRFDSLPSQRSEQGFPQQQTHVNQPALPKQFVAYQQTGGRRPIQSAAFGGALSCQSNDGNYGAPSMNIPLQGEHFDGIPSVRGEIPREPVQHPGLYGFKADVMNSPRQYESSTIGGQSDSAQLRRHRMHPTQQRQSYQDYVTVGETHASYPMTGRSLEMTQRNCAFASSNPPQPLHLNIAAGPPNDQAAYQGSAYWPPNSYQGDVTMNFAPELNANQGYRRDSTPLDNQSTSATSVYQQGYLPNQSNGGHKQMSNAANVTSYPADTSFQSSPQHPMSNQHYSRNDAMQNGSNLRMPRGGQIIPPQQYLGGGSSTEGVHVQASVQNLIQPSQGQTFGNGHLGYQYPGISTMETRGTPQESSVGMWQVIPSMSGQSQSQYPEPIQKSRMPTAADLTRDVADEESSKSSEYGDTDSTESANDPETLRYEGVERTNSVSVTGTDESQESNGSSTSDDRSESVDNDREYNIQLSANSHTGASSDEVDCSRWEGELEEESKISEKRERRIERGEFEKEMYGDVLNTGMQVVGNERSVSPVDDLEEIVEPLYRKENSYKLGSGQDAIPPAYRDYTEMENKDVVDIERLDPLTVAPEPKIRDQNRYSVGSEGADDMQHGSMIPKETAAQSVGATSPRLSYKEGGDFVSNFDGVPSHELTNGRSAEDSNADSQYVSGSSYPSNARFQMDENYFSSDTGLDRPLGSNPTEENGGPLSEAKPYRPLSIAIPPLDFDYLKDSPASPIPVIAVNDDVILPEGCDAAQGPLHDSGFGEERQAKVSPEPMDNIREDEKQESRDADHEQHPAGKVHLLRAYLTNTYPDHKALLAMPGLTLPLPEDGLRSPGALSIVSVATVEEGTQTELPFAERSQDVGTQGYRSRLDASELEHLRIERARIIEALGRDPYLTSTAELEALLNYSMGETKALLEVVDDPWYTDIMLPLFPGESKEIDEKIISTTQEYVEECRKEVLPVIADYEERRVLAAETQQRFAVVEDQKRAKKNETFLERHRDLPDVKRSPILQRRVSSEFDTPRSPRLLRRTYSETDSQRSPGTQRRALYSVSEIHRILGTDRIQLPDANVLRSPTLQRQLYQEEDNRRSSSSLQRMLNEADSTRRHSSLQNLYADSHIALNRVNSLDIPVTSVRSSTTTLQHDHTSSSGSQISPRPAPPMSPCTVSPPQYSSLVTKHPTINRHDLIQAQGVNPSLSPWSRSGVHPPLSPRDHDEHSPRVLSPRVHGLNQPLTPTTQGPPQGQLYLPISPRGSHPSEHKENLLSVRRELVNETILSRSAPSSPRS